MPSCFVRGCQSGSKKKEQEHTLHSFPRDQEMISRWLFRLGHEGEMVYSLSGVILANRTGAYRICSKHFTQDSYELRGSSYFLKKDALPSLFLDSENQSEHTYAKKRKLEEDSPETASTSQTTAPLSDVAVANAVSVPIEQPQEPFSGPDLILPVSYEYVSCIELIGVQAVEEIKTWSTPDVDNSTSYARKNEKVERTHKTKLTRTIHTSTEYFPGQSHKHTQFDKRMGMKDKNIQALRRPPRRSIGIQCNLVSLPRLSEGSSFHQPKNMDINETRSSVGFQGPPMSHRVAEPSQPLLGKEDGPGILPTDVSQLGVSCDNEQEEIDRSQSVKEGMNSPKRVVLDASYQPKAREEEQVFQDMQGNKELYIDPDDLDSSFILLANEYLPTNFVTERKLIVFESCLDKLLKCCKCQADRFCQGNITDIIKYRIGSAVSVTAYCSNRHHFQLWRSQPMIGRKPVGNLLISAGIVCSGSNFVNMKSFFSLLNIFGISKSSHCKNQELFVFPSITRQWQLNRRETLKSLDQQPVAIVGDGQFDLPGHSENYCMYSFMDAKSKKIVDFHMEQVKPSSNATALECKAFKIGLDRLLDEGISIKVVCTDQNMSIRKLLQDHYSFLIHQFGIWHVAKSIGNKIAAASRKARCAQLSKWVKATKNHLRWAARACGHNSALLVEQWSSIVYHITNQHCWHTGDLYKECHHAGITEEEDGKTDWLETGSAAHGVFKDIVLNKKLIKDLKQLSFCHSGDLEVFHSTIQKYRSKHKHYCMGGMVARTQLAALDHNHNINRVQTVVTETTADDRTLYHRTSKEKKWMVEKIYEPSSPDFLKIILLDVLALAARN
ncbi:uncharacterized protein [Pyxicephalus adspersus]|uniref:uncharacterized protein n=1 Tax=Pyxicephalus adspersus TaxID=30357 RepID=UPI003B59E0AB